MMSVLGVSDHVPFGKPLIDDAPSGFRGGPCSKGELPRWPEAKGQGQLRAAE